jgi:hypothetical protein
MLIWNCNTSPPVSKLSYLISIGPDAILGSIVRPRRHIGIDLDQMIALGIELLIVLVKVCSRPPICVVGACEP